MKYHHKKNLIPQIMEMKTIKIKKNLIPQMVEMKTINRKLFFKLMDKS